MKDWSKKKPKFGKGGHLNESLLLAATYIKREKRYHVNLFEILKTSFEDKWYWGIFKNGDEWGDYSEIKADLYLIMPLLKKK